MNSNIESQSRYKLVPEEYLINQFECGWKPVVIESTSEIVEVDFPFISDSFIRDPYYKFILCERRKENE